MDPISSEPVPASLTSRATRQRLLDAAAELFSLRGFAGVSVRQIGAAAGVGHAGVNYHFGSKRKLYEEVVRTRGPASKRPSEATRALIERARLTGTRAGAIEALQEWIRVFLRDVVLPPDSVSDGLLMRELSDPSGSSEELLTELVKVHAEVEELIQLVRPDLVDPHPLRIAGIGVISQCVFYLLARNVSLHLLRAQQFGPELIEELETHIVRSCLRGLLGAEAAP